MERKIRHLVKCPLREDFIDWKICSFNCKWNIRYDRNWKGSIWCSYKGEAK